ncbi:MAG: IS110 family transposase, partial [Acidithiobacillus sp.]
RRPHNVTVVALANKMARTIWALLVKNTEYVASHTMNAASIS